MKELKYFNTNNDYTSNKDNLTYPTVSYVEENTNVYYVKPPVQFISLHYEIKDDEQLQTINSLISMFGNKLPLLMRSDLIAEAKLDGVDITSQLHQGEPHVFTGTTADEKMNEFEKLIMNESGLTDYSIAVDSPFEVGQSWDLEIKFKEGITDCIGLFMYSMALNEIPENLFNNCTAVTDFIQTFIICVGLTNIPEKLFSNCTAVTDFIQTFIICARLTSIPENLFSNNTAVTSFESTFQGCSGLTSIPENLFSNNTAVTNFSQTFSECNGLTNIPENLFSKNTIVTDFSQTFYQCSGLTGNTPVDSDGTSIYNRSGEGKEGYAIVTTYKVCFQNCTGLTDYDLIPTAWK